MASIGAACYQLLYPCCSSACIAAGALRRWGVGGARLARGTGSLSTEHAGAYSLLYALSYDCFAYCTHVCGRLLGRNLSLPRLGAIIGHAASYGGGHDRLSCGCACKVRDIASAFVSGLGIKYATSVCRRFPCCCWHVRRDQISPSVPPPLPGLPRGPLSPARLFPLIHSPKLTPHRASQIVMAKKTE